MESGCTSTAHWIGGFTLLELLITVGVAAILAAIGMPAMATFVENYRQNNAAASLVTSLNYARNEAIKEDVSGGGGITACASASGLACDSANWATGWIVMTPNPQAVGQNVLQKVGALSTGLTLTATPANASILFQADGTAPALSVNGSRAMFKLCDTRGAGTAREIEVSKAGIIQASYKQGYDVSGLALTCP